jgi:predicted PolB exonuclease-like 3'-5' exonuclease
MTVVIDIECVATADALASYDPADREPPANYKSEEAIAKWREKDQAAFLRDATFSPRTSQVVAVGICDLGADIHDTPEAVVHSIDTLSESMIVDYAMRSIRAGGLLVTFNGLGFDLPFLFNRAALLGVHIPVDCGQYLRRYTTRPHTDIFAVLSNYGQARKGDSLHGWARAFGLPVEDASSGADVAAQYAAGDWDAIRAHCRSDILLTTELYRALVRTGRVQ